MHYGVKIKSVSGGRHQLTVKADDDADAERAARQWARDMNVKVFSVQVWEILTLDGVIAPTT